MNSMCYTFHVFTFRYVFGKMQPHCHWLHIFRAISDNTQLKNSGAELFPEQLGDSAVTRTGQKHWAFLALKFFLTLPLLGSSPAHPPSHCPRYPPVILQRPREHPKSHLPTPTSVRLTPRELSVMCLGMLRSNLGRLFFFLPEMILQPVLWFLTAIGILSHVIIQP